MTKLHTTIALLLCTAATLTAQNGTATYRVTFASTWSQATHPIAFPSNPHYSSLIGGLHNAGTHLWQNGGIASTGIEQMAETGGTFALTSEVNQLIQSGAANRVVRGGGLGTSPSMGSFTFTADASHSYLTLVSMLAPSPDWFIGIDALALIDHGRWINRVVIPLHLYDAGTDNGSSYTSPNSNTSPKAMIGKVTTVSGPFKGLPGPIGSITIERLGSALVYGCGTNPTGSMTVTGGVPGIGRSIGLAVDDPGLGMGLGAQTFLFVALQPSATFPCGTMIPGFGLGANGVGELLIASPLIGLTGPSWNGQPATFSIPIPQQNALVGGILYLQGALVDNRPRLGLTDAVEVAIGR